MIALTSIQFPMMYPPCMKPCCLVPIILLSVSLILAVIIFAKILKPVHSNNSGLDFLIIVDPPLLNSSLTTKGLTVFVNIPSTYVAFNVLYSRSVVYSNSW